VHRDLQIDSTSNLGDPVETVQSTLPKERREEEDSYAGAYHSRHVRMELMELHGNGWLMSYYSTWNPHVTMARKF